MKENYEVLAFRKEHTNSVYSLAKEQFADECWSQKQFENETENACRNNLVLVEKKTGKVVCFLIATDGESECEILYLATKKCEEKRGLASLLFDEILKMKKCLFLEVKESNLAAISFYLKHGFSEFSRRKNYYPDGSDAVLMRRVV